MFRSSVENAPLFQSKINGAVPLLTVRSIVAFALLHVSFVEVALIVAAPTLLMFAERVAVQPFESVTVTE